MAEEKKMKISLLSMRENRNPKSVDETTVENSSIESNNENTTDAENANTLKPDIKHPISPAEDKNIKENTSIQSSNNDIDTSAFSNYTSDFSHTKKSILSKIKTLKRLPKTRTALVWFWVGITMIFLVALYFLNPEKYWIQNYKANLLEHENKNDISPTIVYGTPLVWKEEEIKKWWHTLTIHKALKEDWTTVYKYNNIIIEDINTLYKKLESKAKSIRVHNFLLPKK